MTARITMAQEAVMEPNVETKPEEDDDSPLLVCKHCNHIVPRTIVCLYCGALITRKALD
ncbi:MAG: hypothetical protein JSV18_02250 [Candidatus Bathyarchaeota archaeon]|nr:MAG: hypothetical protein JSV18_02250 [Candidatus Bathyarchaeota archaeon]